MQDIEEKSDRFNILQTQIKDLIERFEKAEQCEVTIRLKDNKPEYYMVIEMNTIDPPIANAAH